MPIAVLQNHLALSSGIKKRWLGPQDISWCSILSFWDHRCGMRACGRLDEMRRYLWRAVAQLPHYCFQGVWFNIARAVYNAILQLGCRIKHSKSQTKGIFHEIKVKFQVMLKPYQHVIGKGSVNSFSARSQLHRNSMKYECGSEKIKPFGNNLVRLHSCIFVVYNLITLIPFK